MDWIPWQKGLAEKQEVLRMARKLSRSNYEVAGQVMRFWEWADSESADGHFPGLNLDDLANSLPKGLGLGFLAELVAVGWLVSSAEGLIVPNFDRWLGRSAKKRLRDSQRKKNVRNLSASKADISSVLSSEDLKPPGTESVSEGGLGGRCAPVCAQFADFWAVYPRHEREDLARRAWGALFVDGELMLAILAAVQAQKKGNAWREGYVPQAHKWLAERRWQDEVFRPAGKTNGVYESPEDRQKRITLERREATEKNRKEADAAAPLRELVKNLKGIGKT